MTVASPQRVSRDGRIELVQREAIVLVPYPDGHWPDGRQKWSQGMGCQTNYRSSPPRPVEENDPAITVEIACEWLNRSIAEREELLNRWLTVDVTDPQFDALHSILYQSGSAATRAIIALYNEEKPHLAMLEFARFPFGANKVPNEGHAKRRLMEIAISWSGDYGDQDVVKVYDVRPVKGAGIEPRLISASTLPL